jgi:autonomous glycyl radical cofactor GrcA
LFLFLQFVCRERCRVLSQIIAERTAAGEVSDLQFFSEAVDSVLVRRVTENNNNFVDAQFLQAAWPLELDNVRLLIVFRNQLGTLSAHNWNLFTPRADARASIEGGQEWTGRDVILSLKDGHFTILRHQDPNNRHPIQDLLDKMLDPDVASNVNNHPGERKLLHLESTLGGEPDRTRCMSVAQLHAQQLALPELSSASESVEDVVHDWSSVATIDAVYGTIEQIDAAVIDWEEEYKAICSLESAPFDLISSLDQRRAQVQGEVFAAVRRGQNTLVVQQAGFGKTFMCMRLLSQTNFVLFLVPTNQLLKQMVADITQLGHPCKSWGPDQSKGDASNIVASSVAVVAVFDHMHELASVAKVAKDCKKEVIVVADEAHQFIKDRDWRRILNRSWELSSQLREAKVKAAWILLSATLRAEDDCNLAEALQVDIDVVVRDELKQPQDVNVQVITTVTLEEAVDRAKAVNAQIIFVKKYAEANKVAELLGGAAVWASKLPDDEKNQAIAQFEAGNVLVATYGLATGLNLLVQGRFPRCIAALGLPWSAEATVQLIGRERDGGDVYIIHWDLESTAHKGMFVCCDSVLYVYICRRIT